MKKFIYLVLFLMLGNFAIYAQAVATNTVAATPDSIDNVITFVLGLAASIPAIGTYLAMTLKILGIIAAVLTAISALLIALSGIFKATGLTTAESYIQKILPYVQFASMYNVQK